MHSESSIFSQVLVGIENKYASFNSSVKLHPPCKKTELLNWQVTCEERGRGNSPIIWLGLGSGLRFIKYIYLYIIIMSLLLSIIIFNFKLKDQYF